MTRLETLIALKKAVEAGVRPAQDGSCYKLFGDAWVHVYDIYSNGSLDAAKALHEAVLPGWEWHLGPSNAKIYPYSGTPAQSWGGMADNPARAWLLAILSALIAMETDR